MFRLDDLMVSVLPSRSPVMENCEEDTIVPDTGNTVCQDSSTAGCAPDAEPEPAVGAWRSAQYAQLAQELEGALAD